MGNNTYTGFSIVVRATVTPMQVTVINNYIKCHYEKKKPEYFTVVSPPKNLTIEVSFDPSTIDHIIFFVPNKCISSYLHVIIQ